MSIKIDRTKLSRSLAKQQVLIPHLESAISEGDFVWTFDYSPKEQDDGWHPSSDCTPSLQQLYLKASGQLEDRIMPALYKTFMVGHFWHQYLQHMLLSRGFCELDSVERKGGKSWGEGPYKYVTGSADVAPLVVPEQGEYLLDIKTMNSHDFRGNGAPGWTVEKWECQMNIYMDFFDLDRAMILGVQKDSPHDFREFHFTRNDPLIDALYIKWKLVAVCLDEGIIPPEEEEILLPLKGTE